MTKEVPLPTSRREIEKLVLNARETPDRIVITFKGERVAGLISISDLEKLEGDQTPNSGLFSIVGKWEDFKEVEKEIGKIVKSRKKAKNRAISL